MLGAASPPSLWSKSANCTNTQDIPRHGFPELKTSQGTFEATWSMPEYSAAYTASKAGCHSLNGGESCQKESHHKAQGISITKNMSQLGTQKDPPCTYSIEVNYVEPKVSFICTSKSKFPSSCAIFTSYQRSSLQPSRLMGTLR